MLIESLVRLPENYLHIQESERVLKQEDKFKELIDLYYTKKLHNKGELMQTSVVVFWGGGGVQVWYMWSGFRGAEYQLEEEYASNCQV